jgi:hypothetical protein
VIDYCYQTLGKAGSSISKEYLDIKTSLAGPRNPLSLQRSVNFRSIVEILIDGWLTIDGDTGKIRGVNTEMDL